MKILLVTSHFSAGEIRPAGGQHTFNWVKHLSGIHDLSPFSFISQKDKRMVEFWKVGVNTYVAPAHHPI